MQKVTTALAVPVVTYKERVLVGFSQLEYVEAFKDY